MMEMAVNAPYASAAQPMVLRAVALWSFIEDFAPFLCPSPFGTETIMGWLMLLKL